MQYYTPIRLVVEGIELEGVDGKKGGEGPHVEMRPRAPSNLKTALIIIISVLRKPFVGYGYK